MDAIKQALSALNTLEDIGIKLHKNRYLAYLNTFSRKVVVKKGGERVERIIGIGDTLDEAILALFKILREADEVSIEGIVGETQYKYNAETNAFEIAQKFFMFAK